jgi:hypothetical protein
MSYYTAKKSYENEKQIKDESTFNELKCFVEGCENRWTVKADGDKPKCSRHQWGEKKVYRNYTEPKEIEFADNEPL